MVIEVSPVSVLHVPELLKGIRPDDVQEMEAIGLDVEHAVRKSIRNSLVAWSGFVDGELICMFGVANHEEHHIGIPWMFGTVLIDKYEKVFLRRCKKYVKEMLTYFPVLVNYVDCRNERAIKWLKWLGFTFADPVPYGVKQEPFYPFWMKV